MNPRASWSLFFSAILLLALIVFVERPRRKLAEEARIPLLFPKLNPAQVSRIRLRWRGQPETVLVRTNDRWSIDAPVPYAADSAKTEAFLRALTALQWQERISALDLGGRSNVLEEFGFTSPQAALRLEAAGYERHLLLGSRLALGDQVAAQIVGGDGFYLLDAGILGWLPADQYAWRDRRLLEWTTQPGDRVTVTNAAGSFELENDATNRRWSLVWPLPSRADNQKIDSLLAQLQTLRVEKFVTDDPAPDLDSYGLQTPSLSLFLSRGTNERAGLLAGASPTNAPGTAYARRPNARGVFLVAVTNLEPWRASLAEFRDRHILDAASNSLGFVEIDGADQTRLHRGKDGRWTMLEPRQFPVDAGVMAGLLSSLTGTEVSFGMAVVSDFSTYGLTNPALRIRLWSGSEARPASLVGEVDFGATNAGRVYVRRADETAVNSISLEEYERLPRVSWELRDRRVWKFSPTNVASLTVFQHGDELRLIRRGTNGWSIAPGYQGFVNTDSLEEGVARLGALEAVRWSGLGPDPEDLFGVKAIGHRITLDVRDGQEMRELNLEFGGTSGRANPYASVVLDGERWFFEFPLQLYLEFVQTDMSIRLRPPRPRP